MAAIGKIRKHYGLLVVIVGLALMAFVLGDLLKSTNSSRRRNVVATVGNERISYQDYSNLVNLNLENAKANNLKVGFYHFLNGNSGGRTQAEYFYNFLKENNLLNYGLKDRN